MTDRCSVCIYPKTRPDADFVGGVCSACREYEAQKYVDWGARLESLKALLATDSAKQYHCVVPVSGGKDSTYQLIKLQDMGARVLAVSFATDYQTPLGRRNLDNLKNYADLIEVTPNLRVRKALVRLGLKLVGDLSWPEHAGIWSVPMRVAAQMGIPWVIYGEQPQRAYATPAGTVPAEFLDEAWVSEFGGMLGLRVDDLVGMENLTEHDLELFRFPHDLKGTKGIWLGDYVKWDGYENAFIAQQHGFEVSPIPVEGSAANYENLDNYVTVLRDHQRFLKYNYTRATDILCNHVRHGRISRDEALKLEEKHEVQILKTSLGKPISDVLGYFGISNSEFAIECDKWIWK